LTRRALTWLESHVWSSFKVTASATRSMTAKERWQVLGFTTALVVAMIAAFTIILIEDGPSAAESTEVQ
jgi:hypothetical protein